MENVKKISAESTGGHQNYDLKEQRLGPSWKNAMQTTKTFKTTLSVTALIEFLEIKCNLNNFINVIYMKGTEQLMFYNVYE